MKRLLVLPFLLWATTAWANPSNSLSLTNAVSGTVISSSAYNTNNNTTVSTYNTHTHTDISQLATVTVGVWNATPVQIQFGGTGQTTANAAFASLCPMTNTGDMEYLAANTTPTRIGIGGVGTFLVSNGTTPSWSQINLATAAATGTSSTAGQVYGILPSANGGGLVLFKSGTLTTVASSTIAGLSSGVKYKLVLNLIQNTTAGIQYLQFNGDSGSNYNYNEVVGGGQVGPSQTTYFPFNASNTNAIGSASQYEILIQSIYGNNDNIIASGIGTFQFSGNSLWYINMIGCLYTGSGSLSYITIGTSAATISGNYWLYYYQ